MKRPTVRRITGLAVTVALGLAGCQDSDTGEQVASSSESTSGSGGAAAEEPCAPVGADLAAEADTTLDLTLTDYAFEPSEITADAGVVTFATTNVGEEAHELAFLPGGGEVPFTDEGVPDEDALAEAGAFELEAYSPGQSCNATYDLEPGTYTMFCIVEAADGETHYEKGMQGALTVR